MENWIGVAIWIVIGAFIGIIVRAVIRRPEETGGHLLVLVALGAFGAVVGGMLGVGIGHLFDPTALSPGGMIGAVVLATFMTGLYRWGLRGMI